MPSREPVVIVRELLMNEWDDTATALGSTPTVHTGWYDDSSTSPQITVTNPDENTINGGDTGYAAMNSATGSGAQLIDGIMLVNAWAGTRADLEGEGSNGEDLNPKQLRWQMKEEVERITRAYSSGYTDSGNVELSYIVPRRSTGVVETNDRPHAVYRYETTVGYGYGPVSE